MTKRTIEIDDTLQERVDGAIEEVKQELMNYLEENEPDELPCLNNDLDYSGAIHEIVDGSVPCYTKEVEDTWYLYANELEQAYENVGVGNNPRENGGMAAIYFYIQEQVAEWYNDEAETLFNEWKRNFDANEIATEIIDDLSDEDKEEIKNGSVTFLQERIREELYGDVETDDVLDIIIKKLDESVDK